MFPENKKHPLFSLQIKPYASTKKKPTPIFFSQFNFQQQIFL